MIYPVGALYISTISTSPATLMGGTWVQISDGAVLRAGGKFEYVGSDTCTLTKSQIPQHEHFVGTYGDASYQYIFSDTQSYKNQYLGTLHNSQVSGAL